MHVPRPRAARVVYRRSLSTCTAPLFHESTAASSVSGHLRIWTTTAVEQGLDISFFLFVKTDTAVFNEKTDTHFKILLQAEHQ